MCYHGLSIIISLFCSSHCKRFNWTMNVLENGTDVNAWNNIRYLFMMYIIINGFLILVLAFISASFSSRFKYYYDLDVNLIRCRADVKAKNSIRNLMMMMTRDVIGHSDWIEERILCCEKMVRYLQMMMIPIMMMMIIIITRCL